jgi:hypothetical protein
VRKRKEKCVFGPEGEAQINCIQREWKRTGIGERGEQTDEKLGEEYS